MRVNKNSLEGRPRFGPLQEVDLGGDTPPCPKRRMGRWGAQATISAALARSKAAAAPAADAHGYDRQWTSKLCPMLSATAPPSMPRW